MSVRCWCAMGMNIVVLGIRIIFLLIMLRDSKSISFT